MNRINTPVATFVLLVALCVVLAIPSFTSAQTRAGVPIDRVTPPGMHLVDVQVVQSASRPVRLAFAETEQGRPTILIDVLVAASSDDANQQADWIRETIAGEAGDLAGIGERAFGDSTMITFVRHNVFVSIRSIDGRPVANLARRIDRAVRRASAGTPVSRALSVSVDQDQNDRIRIAGETLAVEVEAEGDAYARRTRTGWTLVRTGGGAYNVRAFGVDRMLRYTSGRI